MMSAGGRRESTCLGGKEPDTTNCPLDRQAIVLRGHGPDEGKVRLKPHATTAAAYGSSFDAESLKERVGAHGPGVPMAAFVLVVGVAHAAVVAFACGADDLLAFLPLAYHGQMAGYLVFDPGADLF